jgi:hypothetical protein
MGCCSSKSCPVNIRASDAIQTIETDGYYVIQPSDLDIELLERTMKFHCMPITRNNDSKHYLEIFPPADLKSTIEKLDTIAPIYRSMDDVTDGTTFTWLVSDRGFFACEASSVLELGSTHISILIRSGHVAGEKVYSAGECTKTLNEIYFNVASGCISRLIKNKSKVIAKAKEVFRGFSLPSRFVDHQTATFKTMITSSPTDALLHKYKTIGYDVRMFNTEENCTVLQPISKINDLRNVRNTLEETNKRKSQLNNYIEKFRKAEFVGGKSRRQCRRKRRSTRKHKH